jgi:hypothetical protein
MNREPATPLNFKLEKSSMSYQKICDLCKESLDEKKSITIDFAHISTKDGITDDLDFHPECFEKIMVEARKSL